MKITMVAATSLDGFITRGNETGATAWTSKEDKAFFSQIKSEHTLLVMGSRTYDALPKPLGAGNIRVVLTSNPGRYSQDENAQLLFMSLEPQQFIKEFSQFKSCLLLGGSHLYTSFLRAGLVDEIYLTIEPVEHGNGTPLVQGERKMADLTQLPFPETTVLNNGGTKLLHYILKK